MTMPFCGSIESISRHQCGDASLSTSGSWGRRTSPWAAPRRLAIYYGYPSLVNDASGDLDRAAAVFSEYDVVMLGDGLEFSADQPGPRGEHPEHAFTKRLIERLAAAPRHTTVYGYVDLGSTQSLITAEIERRVDLWAHIGALGVLFDEAGYDFGVTRERQNAAVAAAHRRGLRACLNAFRTDDVFNAAPAPLNDAGGGNPNGLATIISERDMVLLESFAIRDGVPEDLGSVATRVRTALQGRVRFGTRVACVATSGPREDGGPLAQYGWWVASACGLDAYGWGMPNFSAVTSRLPWIRRPRTEPTLAGARYAGEVAWGRSIWW